MWEVASDAQDNEISHHGDFSLVQTKASGARDLVWGVAGWLGGLVPRGPGKMRLCLVSQLRSSWMGWETHPYPLLPRVNHSPQPPAVFHTHREALENLCSVSFILADQDVPSPPLPPPPHEDSRPSQLS